MSSLSCSSSPPLLQLVALLRDQPMSSSAFFLTLNFDALCFREPLSPEAVEQARASEALAERLGELMEAEIKRLLRERPAMAFEAIDEFGSGDFKLPGPHGGRGFYAVVTLGGKSARVDPERASQDAEALMAAMERFAREALGLGAFRARSFGSGAWARPGEAEVGVERMDQLAFEGLFEEKERWELSKMKPSEAPSPSPAPGRKRSL